MRTDRYTITLKQLVLLDHVHRSETGERAFSELHERYQRCADTITKGSLWGMLRDLCDRRKLLTSRVHHQRDYRCPRRRGVQRRAYRRFYSLTDEGTDLLVEARALLRMDSEEEDAGLVAAAPPPDLTHVRGRV